MEQKELLFDVVKRYFRRYRKEEYEIRENDCEVRLEYPIPCALKSCSVIVTCIDRGIWCRAYCKYKAQPYQYSDITEFMLRVMSKDAPSGNFEFDYSDGEIIWKSFLRCSNQTPSLNDVGEAILDPIRMLNKYGDSLMNYLSKE